MKINYNNNKHSHIIRRFLLSYLIVLIIPILLSSWIYFSWFMSTKSIAIDENSRDIDFVENYFDGQMRELNSITLSLGENPLLTDLYDINRELYPSPDMYKVYVANENLTNPYNLTSLVSDYYMIYKNNDIIVSPRGTTTDLDFYYNDSLRYEEFTWDEFWNILFEKFHRKSVLPTSSMLIDGNIIQGIPYIQSLPNELPYKSKAVIFLILNKDEFKRLLSSINIGNSGYTYIMNENNEIIYSIPDNIGEMDNNYIPQTGSNTEDIINIDGKKMIVTWSESDFNGWKYVAVLPLSQAQKEVNRARLTILVVLLISILGGGIVAYLSTIKNAGPLRHIIDMISDIVPDDKIYSNELEHMEKCVENILSDNKSLTRVNTDLNQTILQHYRILYNSFMERLFKKGFESPDDIEIFSKNLDISLSGYKYVAGIIEIGGFSNVLDTPQIIEMDLSIAVVRDELKKTFNDFILIIETSNGVDILILIDRHHILEYKHWLDLCFLSLKEKLLKSHSMSIHCSIGSLSNELSTVHTSWTDASKVKTMKNITDVSSYQAYYNIDGSKINIYYSIAFEERIINICHSGNYKELKDLLDFVYNEYLLVLKTPSNALFLCNEMFGTVINLKHQHNHDDNFHNIIREFSLIVNVDDKFKYVYNALLNECREVELKINKKDDAMLDSFRRYIIDNFNDSNLQISDIATKHNVSVSYLYKFFKVKMVTTFADYLENIRIEHACHLLHDTNTMIKDVAQECGYNSSHVFRRAFKRVKGILPTDIRKNSI